MVLISSVSGIRGTIGGLPNRGLTPPDIVRYTASYGDFIRERSGNVRPLLVTGRDARVSGEMVSRLVVGTLMGMGIDVLDLGMAATPTVEMAVTARDAAGGIIITASHNPGEWNALKLLNRQGEFLSGEEGRYVVDNAVRKEIEFAGSGSLGTCWEETFHNRHIGSVIELKAVRQDLIGKAGFRIAVDCVNSVGGLTIPPLLRELGVQQVFDIHREPTGRFPHDPEPLPENLADLSECVKQNKADVGFAVDPDVDRLAIVCEDGSMFGEEYTLVAVADYILSLQKGNTVSNLSSTRALRDITLQHGGQYIASPVGEANVVRVMKEHRAVIGGEGNGGVIYPGLHYGRDALVGIALFLTHLAGSGVRCSGLRRTYPVYHIVKKKMKLDQDADPSALLEKIGKSFHDYPVNDQDGIKIEFDRSWVHLRKSNTEPVIRVIAEAGDRQAAEELCFQFMEKIRSMT